MNSAAVSTMNQGLREPGELEGLRMRPAAMAPAGHTTRAIGAQGPEEYEEAERDKDHRRHQHNTVDQPRR